MELGRPEHTRPIVLVADEWGGVGGTAGYVVMLARELCRRGYRVAALCHGSQGTAAMRASLVQAGATVHILPRRQGRTPIRQARELVELRRLLRPFRDGVLALMMGYFTRGGSAIVAGRLVGMRAIVRADLTPPEPPITRRASLSLRLKDRLTDAIVVGAAENIRAFQRETGRNAARMSVIHTGIELQRFQPGAWREKTRQHLGYSADEVVVGTVARLDDERKGIAHFIEAAAEVSKANPRARFMIVGEGVRRQQYVHQAGIAGVAPRTRFTGWRSDVPELLDAMDVFVMPSTFEGGPTSVLEAMAMAKAVVATRVGMVPEVVEDGVNGLSVPPGDPAALATAVGRLVDNPGLRDTMGRRARETGISSLGIERMADDYLRLFARALGSPI